MTLLEHIDLFIEEYLLPELEIRFFDDRRRNFMIESVDSAYKKFKKDHGKVRFDIREGMRLFLNDYLRSALEDRFITYSDRKEVYKGVQDSFAEYDKDVLVNI